MTKALMASISLIAFLYGSVASTDSQGLPHDQVLIAIRKLNPNLSQIDTARLTKALHLVKSNHNCTVDWKILIAVAFKESSLRRGAYNASTKDYGLMQINKRNVLRYRLDAGRLLTDEAYALQVGCKILQENQTRYSSTHVYWVGIYRSGTALWKEPIRANAKRYDKHIRLIAKRIEG